jgi:exopolysaccharide biosynthesis polyprenyl glycosylphosphotransferase
MLQTPPTLNSLSASEADLAQNYVRNFPAPKMRSLLPSGLGDAARADSDPQGSWFSGIARQDWAPTLLCLLLDVAAWIALHGLVTYIRVERMQGESQQSGLVSCIQLAIIVTVLFVIGGYDRHTNMRSLDYSTEHILGILVAAAVSFLLIYSAATFDRTMKPSRAVIAVSFLLFLPMSIGYRRLLHRSMAALIAKRSFLVIGSGELAAEFYRDYKASPRPQYLHFVNYQGDATGQRVAGEGSPVVQGNCEARLANLDHTCSGVILAEGLNSVPAYLLERLVQTQFQRTRVYTLEAFYETHWRYVPLHTIDPFWALQTGFQLSRTSPYHYVKRMFDMAVAAILLLLTAPVLAVVAILVRLNDGKPALFRQERAGVDGDPFTVYKFRTMIVRPEDDSDDIYTRKDDPRITRIGRSLRKLRIDELPQLWNVLKGDMSLIGPRAEWIRCTEQYEQNIPFYHFRHLVKPGVTGWAQVNYPYGESEQDAIEKLKYDLYYIRHYSLKLDFMIVLKTIHTMLFGRGR